MNDASYRRLRHALGPMSWLRGAWHLVAPIRDFAFDSSGRILLQIEREFQKSDPWGHMTVQQERERFRRELNMLDAVRESRRFGNALEVGCAEGEFTELLASRCDSLLAADFSATALERARQRCASYPHVGFRQWDLLRDEMPGTFDLIVMVHVLDYYRSPISLRRIRAKVVAGLRPGGFLLLGNLSWPELSLQNSWRHRFLVLGGERLNALMTRGPELKVIDTATSELVASVSHDVLCRKVTSAQ